EVHLQGRSGVSFSATFTGLDAATRSILSLDPKAKAGAKRGMAKVNKLALADEKAGLSRERSGLMRKSLGDKVRVSGSVVYGVAGLSVHPAGSDSRCVASARHHRRRGFGRDSARGRVVADPTEVCRTILVGADLTPVVAVRAVVATRAYRADAVPSQATRPLLQ